MIAGNSAFVNPFVICATRITPQTQSPSFLRELRSAQILLSQILPPPP